MNHQVRTPARQSSRLAKWTLIISISFVILSLSILEPIARSSVKNHDSKFFDLPQTTQSNHSVGVDTQHYQSSEAGGVEATSSSACTFCKTLNEPELVVAGTGGNTCRSIQLLAAKEVNGSDICAIIQKEEIVCCPGPEPAPHQDKVDGKIETKSERERGMALLKNDESSTQIHDKAQRSTNVNPTDVSMEIELNSRAYPIWFDERRVIDSNSHPYDWCVSASAATRYDKKSPNGLFFVRIPKSGPSTGTGVTLRIRDGL